MSLERCPNGHVYNARRYGKICPYCNMKLAGEDEEKKPVGFEPPVELLEEEEEPVCGWLGVHPGGQGWQGLQNP